VFPVALALELNATALLLTNAAGGIRDDLRPGTLMIVDDHINAMGAGPLTGPHHPLFGARFPDQTCVYDAQLRALLDRTAAEGTDGPAPAHGVYAAVAGPAYETPAEIEALRRLGADAVGMSTVPEATVAHAAGLRVCAVSLIANVAAGRPGAGLLAHDEVLAQTRAAAPRMRRVIEAFLQGAP
jgi:purine-nucleoside phosphorylase